MVAYPQPKRRGHFHYPKELVVQAYWCRTGDGVWHEPDMSLSTLADEGFISPMKGLLEQLESEGHDVTAAKLEWLALREASQHLRDLRAKLMFGPPAKAIEQESWDFKKEPPTG
jgi:hypothetical protein